MFRSRRVGLSVLGGCGLLGAVFPVSAALAVTSGPPHIAAHPNSVMVNTSTKLVGTGFPAHRKVVLKECSVASWVVPQNPCAKGNSKSVTTNAYGGFTTNFDVKLCPQVLAQAEPTSEKCYIGEISPSGVDTIRLLGAAPVTVTYP